jgi:hypothetical protein
MEKSEIHVLGGKAGIGELSEHGLHVRDVALSRLLLDSLVGRPRGELSERHLRAEECQGDRGQTG